ncbi:hypothetical protein JTB14_026651 [Gonioctena quinquepunctata]|nr:hypothetical protein JTB14_026651 [Gonioctena quinquepunctata]
MPGTPGRLKRCSEGVPGSGGAGRLMSDDVEGEENKLFLRASIKSGRSSLTLSVLRKLAEDEKKAFPRAAEVLSSESFVDDIITGTSTSEEAHQLQIELISSLKKGAFEAHKWTSIIPELHSNIPPSLIDPAALCLDCDNTTKVSGLKWQPSSDYFTHEVEPIDRICIERHILSEVARVFDPLKILASITFFTTSGNCTSLEPLSILTVVNYTDLLMQVKKSFLVLFT